MKRLIGILLILVMVFSSAGCLQSLLPPLEFSVRFEPNGGTLKSGELEQTVLDGEDAEPPKLTREGYEFAGWDTEYTAIDDDKVITAKWEKLYTVTFDPGEGTLDGQAEQILKAGETPVEPTATRERYAFDGWSPAVEAVSGDMTYTALWSKVSLTAEQIYELVSPCVVEIHTTDVNGDQWLGAGFFINDQGLALTNFHVMEGAVNATATVKDGTEYDITGVVDYDRDLDLCLVQVGISGNEYMLIADEPVSTGQTVYAIGSPRGYTGTLSNGIVSAASRVEDDVDYIQITAPISQGNSGGPLVNEYGEVLGVNTWQRTDGQNLNFAVNISQLDRLSRTGFKALSEFGPETAPLPGYYGVFSHKELESNDSKSLADTLLFGYAYAAEISDDDDYDYFRITITNSCTLEISVLLYDDDGDIGYVFGYFGSSGFKKVDIRFSYDSSTGVYTAYVDISTARDYYLVFMAPSGNPSFPLYYAVEVDVS